MNWQDNREMTKEEYSQAIHRLGMNKAQAGRFLGVSPRTAYRLWDGIVPVPTATALLLRSLLHHKETPTVPRWEGRRK